MKVLFDDFQVRFIFAILSLSLFVSAFLGYRLYQNEQSKNQILQIQNESVAMLIQEFDQGLLFFVITIILLQAVALVLLIVHLTQRVVGPIHRIQGELERAIAENQPANVHPVRKTDEFQEFFKVLQIYVEKFKDHP